MDNRLLEGNGNPVLPKILQEALHDLEHRREQIKALAPAVLVAEEAQRLYDCMVKVEALNFNTVGELSIVCNPINPQVEKVLAFLAEHGYRQSTPAKDRPPIMKSWFCGVIGVHVFILGNKIDLLSGKSCRYEQVGVKEEPVYELKCD